MAVRQQQHHGGQLTPLGLTGADELVDDRLGAVDEVTELRLPQHQRVGVADGVAVLEADRGELGQRRVIDQELAAARSAVGGGGQQLQRGELRAVLMVDDHRVPLREGAAAGVLPGQPDQLALGHQRSQRQQFGERPVDLALVGHLAAPLQHRQHPRVHGEAFGNRHERVTDAGQQRLVHRGVQPARHLLLGLHRLAGLRGVLLQFADLVEHPLQLAVVVAQRVLGLLHRDVAAADQVFGVALAHAAFGADHVVHVRVGHRRVVALVVAAAPVAQHVDDDVLVELLPEIHRQPGHPVAGLRVVAVDVEDRRADHLGDVGAVLAGPGVVRRGGEPDLVVDDDVDGAADPVAGQHRHVQRLGHHALAGERGVAVQHHRHHREAGFGGALVEQVLAGADQPFQHRVDGLQVRRVGGQ